jgi:hypothetical protein
MNDVKAGGEFEMENDGDAGATVILGMRFIAFAVGLILLASGFAQLGVLGSSDIAAQLSAGPNGLLKVFVGIVLIVAGIYPEAISVALTWIFRG